MFCTNCGASAQDGVRFCTECGNDLGIQSMDGKQIQKNEASTGAQQLDAQTQNAQIKNVQEHQQPIIENQPLTQPSEPKGIYQHSDNQAQPGYQQPINQAQPAYQQPINHTQTNIAPKKRRHTGIYILLSILIIISSAILYLLASFSFFKPKDLGVKYTQADFNSVIKKLGIHINADLGNGQTYDNASILAGNDTSVATGSITADTLKDGLSYSDYNWSFTDYAPKSVTLTPQEVTAFFNEIAPSFWWFDKTQVDIKPDGTILTSSQANIKKIKEELFIDVADNIPVPLPDKVNIYTEGDFSIKDNRISMEPDMIKAGPLAIPQNLISGGNLDIFSTYLERFYTIIPELQIKNAGVSNGGFVFEGVIPTQVSITPKN